MTSQMTRLPLSLWPVLRRMWQLCVLVPRSYSLKFSTTLSRYTPVVTNNHLVLVGGWSDLMTKNKVKPAPVSRVPSQAQTYCMKEYEQSCMQISMGSKNQKNPCLISFMSVLNWRCTQPKFRVVRLDCGESSCISRREAYRYNLNGILHLRAKFSRSSICIQLHSSYLLPLIWDRQSFLRP